MSQISPPIRIVLVAAVAFLGAWMLFLRPKTDSGSATPSAPATAPGVKGLSSAADKAKAASAASDATNAKIQSATGEAKAGSTADKASSNAAPAAGKSGAADTAGLPVRVQKALDGKKVLVLFFFNPKSADDKAVRAAVKKVDRWDGEVVVQAADVKSVARYTKIAKGADVEQTPTVVVVDRNAKAERLVGFQDTRSIDQAVVDAMRNSGVLIKDPYLNKLNQVCRSAGDAIFSTPQPTQLGGEVRSSMNTLENRVSRFVARFKGLPAPKRWRAFKKASVAELTVYSGFMHEIVRATGSGNRIAPILQVIRTEGPGVRKAEKSFNARMDKHHVLSCGSNF